MTDPADKDAEIDFRAAGFTAEAAQFPRPPLAVAMLAAFNNVTADRLQEGQRYFPNEHMMRAWERVADTARLTIIAEFETEIERTIKRNADLDAEIAALKAEVARLEAGKSITVDIGAAVAALQSSPELAQMMNDLVNGDPLNAAIARAEAAEARVKELEAGLLPFADVPANGAYGGPLVTALIIYEDETDKRAGKHASLGHEPFARARALLSPKDKTNG